MVSGATQGKWGFYSLVVESVGDVEGIEGGSSLHDSVISIHAESVFDLDGLVPDQIFAHDVKAGTGGSVLEASLLESLDHLATAFEEPVPVLLVLGEGHSSAPSGTFGQYQAPEAVNGHTDSGCLGVFEEYPIHL
jgi:hypothetical protein